MMMSTVTGGPGVEPVRKSLSEGRSTNDSVSGASSTEQFVAKANLRYTSLSEKFLSASSRMLRGNPQPPHGCLRLENVNLFGRNLYNLACALKFSTVLKDGGVAKMCEALRNLDLIK
ncbi:hypothetical protein ANCCEY_01533 [Ancylostoma ceylanicum]|uniref:Uncharacterized protein n=1 Tax=Ancylostoma ceylanicum TaxID=53326 RepID=A0A0D6M5H4_9BILA|nr:hypothetical protein ANCCEY_01533 [Ancylostoma ceylanicum]